MPTASARRAPRLLALVAALVLAAAALAGCAGSSGTATTDPASLVPASAPMYLEAAVRPGDKESGDARAALAKILRTNDPGAELVRLIDRGGRSKGVTFNGDIEPWLGDRVGVGVLSFAGRRPDAVVVAASTDDAKARQALAKLHRGAAERSYRGVDYTVDSGDGSAAGVFDGAAVVGTETGFKAAVDASKGDSLADVDALKKARSTVSQERSGFAYLDVARGLRQAVASAGDTAGQVAPFIDPIAQTLPKTLAAALDAEPDLLRIDSAAFGAPPSTQPATSGADALAALPADAWLGAGAGDLGKTLGNMLDGIASQGGLGGIGLEAVLRQIQQSTGIDVRKDVLAWMGDAGVFVAGTTGDARGALVVTSKDPAATRRTVQLLRRLVSSGGRDVGTLRAPGVDEGFTVRGRGAGAEDVLVAAGGDKFVVAVGRRALQEALSPGSRLGDVAAFKDAAGRLGGGVRPSFYIDVQRLVALMDAKKGSGGNADAAREYLQAFGVVTGGAKRDGDITRGRAIATLR